MKKRGYVFLAAFAAVVLFVGRPFSSQNPDGNDKVQAAEVIAPADTFSVETTYPLNSGVSIGVDTKRESIGEHDGNSLKAAQSYYGAFMYGRGFNEYYYDGHHHHEIYSMTDAAKKDRERLMNTYNLLVSKTKVGGDIKIDGHKKPGDQRLYCTVSKI
jgi:hypothetical protein